MIAEIIRGEKFKLRLKPESKKDFILLYNLYEKGIHESVVFIDDEIQYLIIKIDR